MSTRSMFAPAPDPRIVALEQALPKLPPRERQFAESLLRQASRLSEKQWPYVVKLTEIANQPRKKPVVIREFAGVVELLDRAAERLKYPRLMVRAGGHTYRLTIAGSGASVPGSINVTDTRPGESRTWFGRVTREGEFMPSQKLTKEAGAEIAKALRAMAKDPAGTAKAYGIETGACCFCGLALVDKRSVEAGYGPVCAEKWGLPWGG